jgi:uncharacterized membrane protein YcaP (DUF421 family)
MTAVSAACIFIAVITLTRLSGLRSFSKLSGFDFAVTVAIGSVIAGTILAPDPPVVLAVTSLCALYILQISTALLRARFKLVSKLVDNEPLLLMRGNTILRENLRSAKLTVGDLHAKLREANVIEWSEIKAVVLETTGDVSVLHGDKTRVLETRLLEGVRDSV